MKIPATKLECAFGLATEYTCDHDKTGVRISVHQKDCKEKHLTIPKRVLRKIVKFLQEERVVK